MLQIVSYGFPHRTLCEQIYGLSFYLRPFCNQVHLNYFVCCFISFTGILTSRYNCLKYVHKSGFLLQDISNKTLQSLQIYRLTVSLPDCNANLIPKLLFALHLTSLQCFCISLLRPEAIETGKCYLQFKETKEAFLHNVRNVKLLMQLRLTVIHRVQDEGDVHK